MKKILRTILCIAAALLFTCALFGCENSGSSSSGSATSSSAAAASVKSSASTETQSASTSYSSPNLTVTEDGEYTDKDSVALYIHEFGRVPSNYVTKTKARKAGWVSTKGNLWDVLPGKSIGGGGFENDEGLLPDAPGRSWYECDIDYQGGRRNSKRLVYSNDGLIYYTGDHYKTFERLY